MLDTLKDTLTIKLLLHTNLHGYSDEEIIQLAKALEEDIEMFDIQIPLTDFKNFAKGYATDSNPKTAADYARKFS